MTHASAPRYEFTRPTALRALLVGVHNPEQHTAEEAELLLAELRQLVDTLGLAVAGSCTVRIREPQSRYLVGSGKAEAIVQMATEMQADVIIFDDLLTPSQQRNWERLPGGVSVIDRQEVILDIFALHARTKEAVLQVALARARYDLPRLKRRWLHLSRQRGMRGGMMGRGKGEQQIEMDYRQVRARISQLQQDLADVAHTRQVQRHLRERRAVPMAAIVGYTNAGKSSIFNCLTRAHAPVEDKLFATLDSTVRRLRLPDKQELLVSDTVGFIRRLPHLLVEAFKSTLEEVAGADFLLEILDVTSPEVETHHDTTCAVLAELDAHRVPVITVFNKADLIADPLVLQRLRRKHPDAYFVSAVTGQGVDTLLAALASQIEHTRRPVNLLLPHDRHDVLALIHRTGRIIGQEFRDEGIAVQASVPVAVMARLTEFEKNSSTPG